MSYGKIARPVLPPGWTWATINDTGTYINGFAFKPTDWEAEGTPIIRIQNLTDRQRKPNRTSRKVPDVYRIEDGDLLVSWSATLDAFIWRGESAYLNQHIFKVLPAIDKRFLYYLIRWAIRQMIQSEHLHGSTMTHINRGPFLRHEIPLPPLAEQSRIGERIEELFGEIEAGEQELEKAREGLAAYRRAVLKAAITGELTREWREKNAPNETGADLLAQILIERRTAWEKAELAKLKAKNKAPNGSDAWKERYQEPEPPEDMADLPDLPVGWTWATVDQLCWLMQYGSSAKCSSEDIGVPVLRMGNIQDGLIDYGSLKYLPKDHSEFPELLLDAGDVLFNRTNSAELVGKTAVYDGRRSPCSFASYLIRIKLTGVAPKYFSYVLNSAYGRAWVAENKNQQVGQANLSGGKLKRLCIPVPPEAEQKEIVRQVEELLVAASDLEADRSIWTDPARLRQSILTAAFAGKLVPQDPNDEPASILLERVRAAKTDGAPTHRTGKIGKRH